jgi:hypothetical protein
MVEVVGDRLVEGRQRRVDQQMVVARVLAIRASGGDAHVARAESARLASFDAEVGCVVDGVDGAFVRRSFAAVPPATDCNVCDLRHSTQRSR